MTMISMTISNYFVRICFTLCMMLWPFVGKAQTSGGEAEVRILIADSLYAIDAVSTQLDMKRGWDVAGLNVGRHAIRYLYGTQSRQIADSRMPVFVILPAQGTLYDYAILRLKPKKQMRVFPMADVRSNDFVRIDLRSWRVTLDADEAFRIQPLRPLDPGEYVFVNTAAPAIDAEGNVYSFGFTIR